MSDPREARVNPLRNALTALRVIHATFVTTWFLFLLAIHLTAPVQQHVSPTVVQAIALVAVTDIALALYLRSQYMGRSVEVLREQPADTAALARWRTGNIVSFTFAETITLCGLALKFLGADWRIAGPFFAVGLVLLLLWFPRLDIADR